MALQLKFRKLIVGFAAELLATCFFVFNVVGAILASELQSGSPFILQIAVTAGLSIAVLATAIGHVTGGQINPVVSLSFIITRKIPPIDGLVFICAQISGGILGASLLYSLIPSQLRSSFGVTELNSSLSLGQGVGMEILLTFLLVFTIHSATDSTRTNPGFIAPVVIGLGVFICHMVGIQWTGCSMNPARSLGPAVLTNRWKDHWVYWVGPIVGAVPAGVLYEFVFSPKRQARVDRNASQQARPDENL